MSEYWNSCKNHLEGLRKREKGKKKERKKRGRKEEREEEGRERKPFG